MIFNWKSSAGCRARRVEKAFSARCQTAGKAQKTKISDSPAYIGTAESEICGKPKTLFLGNFKIVNNSVFSMVSGELRELSAILAVWGLNHSLRSSGGRAILCLLFSVFFSGGIPAANMPLCFVLIQYMPDLVKKTPVVLGKSLGQVFMHGRFGDSEMLCS